MNSGKDLKFAGKLIREGEIVAFPTETVYGLGANAFNPKAVLKIFNAKERPAFDPLIVHISKLKQLDMLCKKVDKRLLDLAERFWPGPLTIVVEKNSLVPDIVTSGLGTVGIRMPAHPIALELINEAGTPIAAPSANKFGMISPTEHWHVAKQLPDIAYIIEGGKARVGIESTVISLQENGFKLLRPGVITLEELEKELPQIKIHDFKDEKLSPGLLKSHYSPVKPIYLTTEYTKTENLSTAGLISFGVHSDAENFKKVEVLSERKDLEEAAINLFGAMHNMETADVDFILIEPVPETGIGVAIMDRLRKAVYQYRTKD